MNPVLLVILISIAGPLIGSFIGVIRMPSERFTMSMLAFAAGAMLGISFLQLIPASLDISSIPLCVIGIMAGAATMYIIDKAVPHIHPALNAQEQGCRLRRTATYLIIGIFMHNFPEGLAIGSGFAARANLGLGLCLLIGLHNIPEGIALSCPTYACGTSRFKTLIQSLLAGFPTVLGAITGFLVGGISNRITSSCLGFAAGAMFFITCDELIPECHMEAEKYGHIPILSIVVGFIIGLFFC